MVNFGMHVGQDSQHAGVGDQAVGTEWDGYAGAGERFKCTIHGGLDAGINKVGAVAGAPAVGGDGQLVSDEHDG